MAELYAENRDTFQGAYAGDCWREVTSRPSVAPVVRRAKRVLDVGCGTGAFTAELAELVPGAAVCGVDISEDMVAFAKRRHPELEFHAADLARERADLEPIDVATSTMVLHWPGPDPALLRGVFELLKPGGVFVGGLHGAGSCQEGVEAIETAALARLGWSVRLDELPTMFKRDSAHAWNVALLDAGFRAVQVAERTIVTEYASPADCAKRLCAAWPPILVPNYLSADQLPAFMDHAAHAMVQVHQRRKSTHTLPSAGEIIKEPVALMTSHVIEFSAHVPPYTS